MHLLPSDVARLVLGYLKEKSLNKSLVAFLKESPDLSEYWRMMNSGQMPTTTIMGHSLQSILEEHATLTARVRVLNDKLAQYSSVHASQGFNTTPTLDRQDIDAVVESHTKAETKRERESMRLRSKRQGISTQRNEALCQVSKPPQQIATSSSQSYYPVGPSLTNLESQSQPEIHKKIDGVNNSSKNDEPDEDDDDEEFEFDSLDRLLADTKLHEKLALSINKALKRDQVGVSGDLTIPAASGTQRKTANGSGGNPKGGGVGYSDGNIQTEENVQKHTSAVVDNIISMTADEPGLEQLLSLFQFPPESATKPTSIEGHTKSASLYIPEPESNEALSHSTHPSDTLANGHILPQPHKGISDTPNNETMYRKDTHSRPFIESSGIKTKSENVSIKSETVMHDLSTIESQFPQSTISTCHYEENIHMSLKKDNIDNSDNTQAQEQSQDTTKNIVSTSPSRIEHNTSSSKESLEKKSFSPVKPSNPPQNFKKPRVKRCPKKLFKDEDHSSQNIDHNISLSKTNANNITPTNDGPASFNTVTNLPETNPSSQNLPPSQPTESKCLSNAHSGDRIAEAENPPPRNIDSSEKFPFEKTSEVYEKVTNRNEHPSKTFPDNQQLTSSITPIGKYSTHSLSEHTQTINAKDETSASCQLSSVSHNASANPQLSMEENSLSVFSLIRKCTAEIIGEGYEYTSKNPQDDVKTVNEQESNDKSLEPRGNETRSDQLHCFESETTKVSTGKEEGGESQDTATIQQSSPQEVPLVPLHEDNSDSDSSFDGKISTPNAVYVKPVKLSDVATRDRNLHMLDSCLQNILGKIKESSANNGEANTHRDEKQSGSGDEELLTFEKDKEDIDVSIDSSEVSFKAKHEMNIQEKETNSLAQMASIRQTTFHFQGVEELHNFSATISTPFISKDISNADNSPRKLVQNLMKNNESASLPAFLPSSLREKCNGKDHHEIKDSYLAFTPPPVSKFHPQSKENYSPSMSIPQSSRKVIACNIAHSPFVPSHLKSKGPSRRITPTEVSFSTPSPLGLMSPSSPAEFIIDIAQSPSQPKTPSKESKVDNNIIKEPMRSCDEPKEMLQTVSETSLPKWVNANDDLNSLNEDEKVEPETDKFVGEEVNRVPSYPAFNPAPSSRDGNTMNRPLPSSISDRKPRRVVPTLLSTTVSKVGGESFFSSSSCSQNGSMFQQDESKIVSSSSDPPSPHSEAEAFRMLKNIFQSYSKPQPNQEITSSNITKSRCLSSCVRKCGCVSRDVCRHIKGKGKHRFKRQNVGLSRNKDIPSSPNSKISNGIDEINSKKMQYTSKQRVGLDSGSKDGVNNEENFGSEKDTESCQSSSFLPVGEILTERKAKSEELLDNLKRDKGTENCQPHNSNPHISSSECQNDHSDRPKEREADLFTTQHIDDFEFVAPCDEKTGNEDNQSNNSVTNTISKNDNGGTGDSNSKGNSGSSNENAFHRSTEFDHLDNMSLAAPYFPELSNTFDAFKLQKQNTAEHEHLYTAESRQFDSLSQNNNPTKPNSSGEKISPLPGTRQDESLPESLPEDLPSSSCLLSQAMEECGIPFEPSEQSLMEFSHPVQSHFPTSQNYIIPSGEQQFVSQAPIVNEFAPRQLRSATRRKETAKTYTATTSQKQTVQKSSKLPLLAPSQPGLNQPQIILPAQNPPPMASPSPIAPGTVAYFSRPNLPPVPFTILADGSVIVLPQHNSPQPQRARTLAPLLPVTSGDIPQPEIVPQAPPSMPSFLVPAGAVPSNVTNPITKSSNGSASTLSSATSVLSSSSEIKQIDSYSSIEPRNEKVTSEPKDKKMKTSSEPIGKNIKTHPSNEPKDKKMKKKKKKKKRDEESMKYKADSVSVSKSKHCDAESSDNPIKKDKLCSSTMPRQKVAQRRKIEEINSSPKKTRASTYFKKSRQSVKRRLYLAKASAINKEQCSKVIANTESDAQVADAGKDKEIESLSHEDEILSAISGITQEDVCASQEIMLPTVTQSNLPEYDNYSCNEGEFPQGCENEIKSDLPVPESEAVQGDESETHKASDMMMTFLNNQSLPGSPEKTQCLQGCGSRETHGRLELLKHSGSSNSDSAIELKENGNSEACHQNQGTVVGLCDTLNAAIVSESDVKANELEGNAQTQDNLGPCNPVHTGNINVSPQLDNMVEEKETLSKNKPLSRTTREDAVEISNNILDKEKSPVNVKDTSVHSDRESILNDLSKRTSKIGESSSPETENENLCHNRLHFTSTPVDKTFFHSLKLIPTVDKANDGYWKKRCSIGNSSIEDDVQTEEMGNDFVSPFSSSRKEVINKKNKNHKSFSDILKSVSFQYKSLVSSPARTPKKTKPPSDDDDFVCNIPFVPKRKKRSRRISFSSSCSSCDEMSEAHVSHVRIIKDRAVTISVSCDGDVIKDITGSQVSADELMQTTVCRERRRRQLESKRDLHQGRNKSGSQDKIVPQCEKAKEGSPVITETKTFGVHKEKQKSPVCDLDGDLVSVKNGDGLQRSIVKKNHHVKQKGLSNNKQTSQMSFSENETTSSLEKGWRESKSDVDTDITESKVEQVSPCTRMEESSPHDAEKKVSKSDKNSKEKPKSSTLSLNRELTNVKIDKRLRPIAENEKNRHTNTNRSDILAQLKSKTCTDVEKVHKNRGAKKDMSEWLDEVQSQCERVKEISRVDTEKKTIDDSGKEEHDNPVGEHRNLITMRNDGSQEPIFKLNQHTERKEISTEQILQLSRSRKDGLENFAGETHRKRKRYKDISEEKTKRYKSEASTESRELEGPKISGNIFESIDMITETRLMSGNALSGKKIKGAVDSKGDTNFKQPSPVALSSQRPGISDKGDNLSNVPKTQTVNRSIDNESTVHNSDATSKSHNNVSAGENSDGSSKSQNNMSAVDNSNDSSQSPRSAHPPPSPLASASPLVSTTASTPSSMNGSINYSPSLDTLAQSTGSAPKCIMKKKKIGKLLKALYKTPPSQPPCPHPPHSS